MRKQNQKYFIGFLILFLTFELNAQTDKMVSNTNKIDKDFVLNSEFKTKVNKEDKINDEINLILERSNDSLFSIYLVNKTADSMSIATQDWHLFLVQEAKNKEGQWKPIEYWQYSTCGNSYLSEKVKSNGILKTESKAYTGNFKTEVRFKLLNDNKVYYSNSVVGFINVSQFLIPDYIINRGMYANAYELGGSELLNKILFLEPNGIDDLQNKREAHFKSKNKSKGN